MNFCNAAAVANSCNAAARAAASRSRRTASEDDDEGGRFYVLFEEGRLTPVYLPAPAAAADEPITDGDRRSSGHPLSPAWKIAIRSLVAAVTLAAAAFIVWLVARCGSWSEAQPLLAALVMLAIMGTFIWTLTLDCFGDPDCDRKRRTRR